MAPGLTHVKQILSSESQGPICEVAGSVDSPDAGAGLARCSGWRMYTWLGSASGAGGGSRCQSSEPLYSFAFTSIFRVSTWSRRVSVAVSGTLGQNLLITSRWGCAKLTCPCSGDVADRRHPVQSASPIPCKSRCSPFIVVSSWGRILLLY